MAGVGVRAAGVRQTSGGYVVRVDRAALPFLVIAAAPAVVSLWVAPAGVAVALLTLPIGVALFFRDPDRRPPPDEGIVLAPADGTIMHAGAARPGEAPEGGWQQVTVFLSLLDVHINRTPVAGKVRRVEFVPGSFLPAFRADAFRNEHSEIWLDHGGRTVVVRQVVGVLARRVVCRVKPGDVLGPGARIGLMKFGSRMDVFMPVDTEVVVTRGARVRAGETIIGHLRQGVSA